MRKRHRTQAQLSFQAPCSARVTEAYFARYDAISDLLDRHPEIVDAVHEDLAPPLSKARRQGPQGGRCRFSSDTVLRMCIVKALENESFRHTVVRVDDSARLRAFTRIHNDPMMDFTTLCVLANAIRPETWEAVNRLLAEAAVSEDLISGERLRIDTTAVETNVHWPSDSSLMWDTYRTLARLIRQVRELSPVLVSGKRLHDRRAKKLHSQVSRASGGRSAKAKERQKQLYGRLIALVEGILDWVPSLCDRIRRCVRRVGCVAGGAALDSLARELEHYRELGLRVVGQARRRTLEGEKVPNAEKLFSIFEPHTELLVRGKAAKPVEFGHMVAIQQVEGSFITGYAVYGKKPSDHELVDPALDAHESLFGSCPDVFTADKGFWEGAKKTEQISERVGLVAIGKMGRRTEEETHHEHSAEFRLAQRFRAGVEGSIAFLKRVLGLWRCMNKGFERFTSTVASTVFAHNLLVLARSLC